MRSLIKGIKQEKWMILLVVALALGAGRTLLQPGYFNMHDDLQMMRQLIMDDCIKDLQIPCRWTQHMGYGFGFPLFNYYPPLPYLVGEIIKLLGFSFVDTVKATFLLSFILSGLTMYLLGKEFFGRLGGLVASAFYIWAPYHSVDVFVRGAMNEAWALAWFPLILWVSYKLIYQAQFRYVVILALSWFALLTSHNLMVLIFIPVFVGWVLLWLIRARSWFTTLQLLVAGIWGLGLAAFFTVPVYLEKGLVHVETLVQGYYEYIAHFTTVDQILFSRFWGYGPSVWMDKDGMSFQIGHLHWGLSLVVLGLVVFRILRKRKAVVWTDWLLVVVFFFLVGWFAAFMTQFRSTPLWLALDPVIKFVQFPWRFLTLVILSFSLVTGGVVYLLFAKNSVLRFLVVSVLIAGVIFLNKDYFLPEHGHMGSLTDQEKFSGAAWDLQQTAGIYDYLPMGAKTAPKSPQKDLAEIMEGKGEVTNPAERSNWARFKIKVLTDVAKVRVGIFQFPGWKVSVDGKEVDTYIDKDEEWGRMYIDVSKGEHEVVLKLHNTPVRAAGDFVSLFSWIALLSVPLWRKQLS